MIKAVALLGLALIAAPTAAQAGLPDGRLSATSLSSGDFEGAARRLTALRPEVENDPARLINLGNAYLGMGRMDGARSAYIAARQAADEILVLADGTEASSRAIAGKALRRLNTVYASR